MVEINANPSEENSIGQFLCWAAVRTGIATLSSSLFSVPSVAVVGREVGIADVGGSTHKQPARAKVSVPPTSP